MIALFQLIVWTMISTAIALFLKEAGLGYWSSVGVTVAGYLSVGFVLAVLGVKGDK